jgi:hypothetical protein
MRAFTPSQAEDLYELICEGRRTGSIITTSNRAPANSYALVPTAVLAEPRHPGEWFRGQPLRRRRGRACRCAGAGNVGYPPPPAVIDGQKRGKSEYRQPFPTISGHHEPKL